MRTVAEVRRVEHIMGTAISLDVRQPGDGDVGYVFTWLHEVDGGHPPPGDAAQICAALAVEDKCVATSGTYERGQHILDGRTGRPPQGLLSLTVVADNLTTADAVSTAAFAMGGEEGIAWAHAQPGCEVLAVTADRAVRWSDSLESSLIRS